MAAILRIEYIDFFFAKESDAARVLVLLGKGKRVTAHFSNALKQEVFLSKNDRGEIRLTIIAPDQFKLDSTERVKDL